MLQVQRDRNEHLLAGQRDWTEQEYAAALQALARSTQAPQASYLQQAHTFQDLPAPCFWTTVSGHADSWAGIYRHTAWTIFVQGRCHTQVNAGHTDTLMCEIVGYFSFDIRIHLFIVLLVLPS